MARRDETLIADVTACERALADRTTRVSPAPAARLKRLDLSPQEAFVLSRVTRTVTVSEMLAASGLSEELALQALLNLLVKGALLIGEPTAMTNPFGPGFQPGADAMFASRVLQEDVDLTPEQKQQVLLLFHGRDRLSHYRMLGILPTAEREEVRRAYLTRSKELHPDLFFRKNLGTYGPKIEELFRRMTTAHDTLIDDVGRARYDRELQHFDTEEKDLLSRREVSRLEDEHRARARRQTILHGKGFARLTRARELLTAGIAALAQDDFQRAMQDLQQALELDPRLEEARTKLEEIRKQATARRVDSAVEEALSGNDSDGARSLRLLKSALEADRSNPKVHAAIANQLLRSNGDLQDARNHAQRAIDLGDRSGRSHLILGEILLGLGQKRAGKAALQTAVALGEARAGAILKGR